MLEQNVFNITSL